MPNPLVMRSLRISVILFAASVVLSTPGRGQTLDRALSSMLGGAASGFGAIELTAPFACGGVFSDRACHLPPIATGFGLANIVGSTLGAAGSGGPSSCSSGERLTRSFIGTIAGAALGVAGVSRTHGDLRIGLSPLVQAAEGFGAAAMLMPCKQQRLAASDSAALAGTVCRNPSYKLARWAAGAGMAGGYTILHIYFKRQWWSDVPAKNWFVANDWDQNHRDADKFGHILGGYQLTRVNSEVLQAGCVAPERARLWAALYAWVLQFQIAEWDGTQQMYGFEPSDVLANTAGVVFAVAQERTKSLQYIKPLISWRPSDSYRSRNEPGHNGQPRSSTDYSGQTYWFSTDVHSLLPDRFKVYWPALIRLSPGYSITDYIDPQTGSAIRAKRKILLSLDLDLERLPGDNKVWRTVKHELSFLRVPGPTLQLTPSTKLFGAYY